MRTCDHVDDIFRDVFFLGIDLQCFMDMGQNFKETDDIARKCKAMLKVIHLYQSSLSSIEKVNI